MTGMKVGMNSKVGCFLNIAVLAIVFTALRGNT